MKRPLFFTVGLCLFAMTSLTGCGEPKATLVPASGIVTINGQPAANIMVQCSPITLDMEANMPTSQAETDADGRFTLVTLKNEPGAVPGKHSVRLYDTTEERAAQGEEETKPSRLDPKFATGTLEITIKEGEEIKIEATGPQ